MAYKTFKSFPLLVLNDKSSCCLWCIIEPDNAADRYYDVFLFPVGGYPPHAHQPSQKPRNTDVAVTYIVHIFPF